MKINGVIAMLKKKAPKIIQNIGVQGVQTR